MPIGTRSLYPGPFRHQSFIPRITGFVWAKRCWSVAMNLFMLNRHIETNIATGIPPSSLKGRVRANTIVL
jgi:hypothetical protein